jgi:antitoxin component YwqK of YwqJK toxin-antitoxin module
VRFSYLTVLVIFLALIGCTDQEADHSDFKKYNQTNESEDLGEAKKPVDLRDLVDNESNGTFGGNSSPNDLGLPMPKQTIPSGPKNGLIKEYFEDGSIKEEIEYFNGVKEGKRKVWYRSGQLYKSGTMKNDRWHGKYQEWYENGSPKLSGQYMDGQQHGEWVFFDKEGNNLPNLNFENGIETTRKLPKLLGN